MLKWLKDLIEDRWHPYRIYRQTPEGGAEPMMVVRGHARAKRTVAALDTRLSGRARRDWHSLLRA